VIRFPRIRTAQGAPAEQDSLSL